jgi:hypothetical protein
MPPLVLESALVCLVIGVGVMVTRAVKRRKQFHRNASDVILPTLQADTQMSGVVTRYFRDTLQGAMLVEIAVGQSKFIFCPVDSVDSGDNAESNAYKSGDTVQIALYGLATLMPGGFEEASVRGMVSDTPAEELTPDRMVMTPAGQFPNDYWVVGKVYSSREDEWEEDMPLTVYRIKTQRKGGEEFILEMAVPRESALTNILPCNVHGSVRLFGYRIALSLQ